jgi:DNA topoisomerase-1
MARTGGITRKGRKGRFRYLDRNGKEIRDAATLARIDELRVPPAWKEVWIAPRPNAKLQAVGLDSAGRRQYLYHPEYRARQEQAKYDKLVRFGERLPALRRCAAEHVASGELSLECACAIAVRLINLGWFRVGADRYTKASRTFGITTLRKRHVTIRGSRVTFKFRAKHRVQVHTAIVDEELAADLRRLLALGGDTRVFRYERDGEVYPLTARKLNDYIREHMGEDFSSKDFRTWGGTLVAAIALAERGVPETASEQKHAVAAVMRKVGEQLGNTPAVARASYVSPAVVEQYLDGRTIDDFRARHLRVVRGRQIELDPEEAALLSLLRSWRIREARKAA